MDKPGVATAALQRRDRACQSCASSKAKCVLQSNAKDSTCERQVNLPETKCILTIGMNKKLTHYRCFRLALQCTKQAPVVRKRRQNKAPYGLVFLEQLSFLIC